MKIVFILNSMLGLVLALTDDIATLRYQRSADQPWEINPQINRYQNGNVNSGVNIKNKGKDYEVKAGWDKVVKGPGKSKPIWHVGGTFRFKRSPDQPWEINPQIKKDQNGNLNTGVNVKNKGKDYEVEGGWDKVVKGPGKSKPTWHVGGTFRFKRSPDQPWEINPQIKNDQNGKVKTGVNVKNKGKDYEVEGGWDKVVKGPRKSKPTWHVGGTFRFKRSPDKPWEINPQIKKDQNGNVNSGVNIKNKGKDYEVKAGWDKVVKGPGKSKPIWHVGGTFRFKRSPDQPWEINPQIKNDQNGNVKTGVNVKNKGKDYEVEGGWDKVVKGPGKSKPTWHVGGTFRFKRSPDKPWEINPQIKKDQNRNVNTGVNVKNKGKDYEVEGGWNKIVRGPNKSKPVWHVGGTYRFK